MAKSFLKWAGGKQQLLGQYEPFFPKIINNYIEPFLGGGAIFFYLASKKIINGKVYLCDNNKELIITYNVIRDNVDELINRLDNYKSKHSKDFYYRIRDLDRNTMLTDPIEIAARMIYLNKTCYNGLYRVNSKGQFNVPMGSYKNPQIYIPDILLEASRVLRNAIIEVKDFRDAILVAKKGDFVYFDPPYHPLSKTANFTNYTSTSFSDKDQEDLANLYKSLDTKKCKCMLSNSMTPLIRTLYSNFSLIPIQANRAINSKADRRGTITEALVMNYPKPGSITSG